MLNKPADSKNFLAISDLGNALEVPYLLENCLFERYFDQESSEHAKGKPLAIRTLNR